MANLPQSEKRKARDDATKAMGVSPRLVQQAKKVKKAVVEAAEAVLRIRRRIGQWLAEHVQSGGNRRSSSSHDANLITLKDTGVDKDDSSRWQTIAAWAEEAFKAYIADCHASETDITTVGACRLPCPCQFQHVGDLCSNTPLLQNVPLPLVCPSPCPPQPRGPCNLSEYISLP